jgi:hypothetical protein
MCGSSWKAWYCMPVLHLMLCQRLICLVGDEWKSTLPRPRHTAQAGRRPRHCRRCRKGGRPGAAGCELQAKQRRPQACDGLLRVAPPPGGSRWKLTTNWSSGWLWSYLAGLQAAQQRGEVGHIPWRRASRCPMDALAAKAARFPMLLACQGPACHLDAGGGGVGSM